MYGFYFDIKNYHDYIYLCADIFFVNYNHFDV
jgi:hypothetical protein